MAFLAEFIITAGKMLVIAAVAFLGICLGKRLRDRHDAKVSVEGQTKEKE